MKFKDVRTIESILLEYGLKPGAPTPVGDQQSGTVAKTTPKKPTTPPKKDLGSPTVTPGLDIPEPEAPEPQAFKAMDLGDGDEFKDKTGKVVGKVVSKVGDGPQPDKLVVDDGKGEYSFIDPDEEVFMDAPVTEKAEKSGKYSKKNHRKALNKVKPKVRQEKNRVKRLAKLGLKEARKDLFEINFNKKEIVKSSLDASIRCGWEAETIWTSLEGETDDVDNMTLDEVDNNFGGVDYDSVAEGYTDWLYDYKVDDYMNDAIDYWIDDKTEDEDYINDFIDSEGISEDDWAHHREETLRVEYGDERYDEEGPEELSDVYGYEDENWAREYVEEERMDDFTLWLRDIAADDDDVRQDAYERAEGDYDYDDWINSQWYSMSAFCDDYGIDYSVGGSLSEVADLMTQFISDSSAFSDHTPEYGDYGNTSGTTTEYAVESDSSIDGYGTGAEIISPVFSTPRRMLNEMKKFFEWLQRNDVETNSSTGLHITMSYFPEPDAPMDDRGRVISGSQGGTANRVKMAVLLGDQYILSEFNRDRNTYTRSQMADLEAAVKELEQNPGSQGIKRAEEFLEKHISNDKFRSIHFKNVTDQKTGTKLIEFRIAGGEDYHHEMEKIVKAVVRYATIMIAGYTDEYNGDYVKALSRLLNKAKQLQSRDVEEVESLKQRYDDVAGHPILDTHKAIVGSKNYLEFTKTMLSAMEDISQSKKDLEPATNKAWANSWKEFIENTSATMSEFDPSLRTAVESYGVTINEGLQEAPVKQERSIKAYMKPQPVAPEKRAKSLRAEGLRQLSESLGMVAIDVQTNTARSKPNAKSIGALRTYLKQNEISYEDINANIKACVDDFNFTKNVEYGPEQKINIVREGIKKLFQKDIITKPDYITTQQVEAFGKGLWNIVNSKDFDKKKLAEVEDLVIKIRSGDNALGSVDTRELERDIKNILKTLVTKREFNAFYNELSTSGYNHPVYIISPGMIYSKKHFAEFIKYAKTAESYSHPVSRSHNANIFNDDSYEENSLNKYTMLLRRRFKWLEELYGTEKSKAQEIIKAFVPVVEEYIRETAAYEEGDWSGLFGFEREEIQDLPGMTDDDKESVYDLYYERDGANFLGVSNYAIEKVQGYLDSVVTGETERRDISGINSFIADSIRESLGAYYKNKNEGKSLGGPSYSNYYKIDEIKGLMAQRFRAIKVLMKSVDKMFVDNGFDTQDDIIQRKKNLDKDAKAFRNKEANKTLATINIPSHSIMYVNKSDLENIRAGTGNVRELVEAALNVNNGRKQSIFFVIPAAHWGPVLDAYKNMDPLVVQQNIGNHSQDWRLKNYYKLVDEFNSTYNIRYTKLFSGVDYEQVDATDRKKISEYAQIEFTGEQDGRTGMGDVEDLIPRNTLNNPYSGEPLDKNSAVAWSLSEGNDKKMFNAYDWEKYHNTDASKYKKATLDIMNKENLGFYRAIEKVIEVQGAGIGGFGKNAIIQAAGVEDLSGEATATIMDRTNWSNLTDFFKIERGVNDQGINLFKKVTESINEDNRDTRLKKTLGDEEVPVIGIERFILCVKIAKKYIKDNYKISGGNYFRKDAQGNPGDDVSSIYGRGGPMADGTGQDDRFSSGVSEDDYQDMRDKYRMFNFMMQYGMQYYMVQPDVNRLVAFLKNEDNDEKFKQVVLNRLINDKQIGLKPNDFQGALARGRIDLQGQSESVFAKFDKLPLQEQLRIVSESKVLERPLTKDEKDDKEKYVKGMKKSKKDFEKRYGKDAEAVMYATATNMAKEDLDESVPDLNRIRIINKLLADHFPVGDLKKQMLAYEAIPVPQMLTDFRGLIAQAGPDACARGIVRHYVNALSKEEQEKINLNEWSKQHIKKMLKEAPMQLVQDFKNLVIKVAELERDVQSKCTNPKLAKQCAFASKELDDYKQKMSAVQNQIMQFTSTEKDIDTAIQMGREETTSEIRNYQATVDKLLNKLSDKISGGFEYITFSDNGIEQAKEDTNGKKLNAKDKKKQESEVKSVEQIKQALIGYFKDPELFSDNPEFSRAEIVEFLTAAANGEILSMEDIMTIGTDPNLPEMITFPDVVQTAAERHGNQRYVDIYNRLVDDGLMYQTVANTTSGNVGPGELALLLLAAPAEKGARGDLNVSGKEVEIKSGSYSVGDSKTTAGGKFNSDFVVKGNLAGGTLNNLLAKFFKEKLNKDFKKEFKAFMAKQERPNAIRFYKLEPSRMNLPAISDGSFEYVYNPFFKEQNISRDQFRTLARIFSQTTFSSEARQRGGHFYQVVTSLAELHDEKGWYAKQIEELATSKGINGPLLKRLIISLQFQSYYLNKGHDQILYINKTNQKLTNVTNAKDLVDKFDRGIVVAVKDINLTDTQQTAAHSITAGL